MFYKKLINTLPIKKRYLLQFGYIGTDLNGVQRQIPYDSDINADIHTVQGLLEHALSRLRPLNGVILRTSSRTDAGVHAIRSTADVDLEFKYEHQHNPLAICKTVNLFFRNSNIDIRLHNAIVVPDVFSARFNAIWRKYVYRVAVVNDNKYNSYSHNFFIPMTEHYRCLFKLNGPFVNMDGAKACAQIVQGKHDFKTFMSKSSSMEKGLNTQRTLYKFDISPGRSFFDTEWDDQYTYWNFTCVGRGFLYKQVRKLVTAMLGVAEDQLTVEQFKYMLENPSLENWPSHLHTVVPYGLYLMDIGYREEDLKVPQDTTRYSLVIESMQGGNKLEVIKLFRELHGSCSILQARDMLASTPVTLRSDLIEREALAFQELFDQVQCTTRLEKRELTEAEAVADVEKRQNKHI